MIEQYAWNRSHLQNTPAHCMRVFPVLTLGALALFAVPAAKAQTFSIFNATSALIEDPDGDTYYSEYSVTFDANVDNGGAYSVYARMYLRLGTGNWGLYYTTPDFTITGNSVADAQTITTTLNTGYPPGLYDIRIELFKTGETSPIRAWRDATNDSDLNDLKLESQDYEQVFSIFNATSALIEDPDGDTYYSEYSVTLDANVDNGGAYSVYARIYLRLGTGNWGLYYTTPNFTITGNSTADAQTITTTLNAGYPPGLYDVRIELYKAGETTPLRAARDATSDADLNDLKLESQDFETPAVAVVTVAATDATAGEPATGQGNGVFTFSRAGSTASPLTVNFAVGGTAAPGGDYQPLGTTVAFGAGASTATTTVTVVDNNAVESDETVILALAAGTGYAVGSPSNATVTIKDDDIRIVYQSHTVDDDGSGGSAGNGDGKVNPGETIETAVMLDNPGSRTAHNVTAALSTTDGHVTILGGAASYGNIVAGGSALSLTDYRFAVAASCPSGHVIVLNLAISADEGNWGDSFNVAMPDPDRDESMPWLPLLLSAAASSGAEAGAPRQAWDIENW